MCVSEYVCEYVCMCASGCVCVCVCVEGNHIKPNFNPFQGSGGLCDPLSFHKHI